MALCEEATVWNKTVVVLSLSFGSTSFRQVRGERPTAPLTRCNRGHDAVTWLRSREARCHICLG